MHFDSIQFGGGAHYTTLFLGALHQLIKKGEVDMAKITVLGGSSAGSVIALLLNVGFTPKEIFEELVAIDLEEIFLNDVCLSNLFANNGFCYGKRFLDKLVGVVQKKLPEFQMKSTFQFLKRCTNKTLVVSGTNLTQKRVDLFSEKETPTMSVLYAIRLSISIPLLFQTLEYKNNLYVDGCWFNDIRDVDSCYQYFKKDTSLHFVIKYPKGLRGSLVDIASLLRAYFVESYWVVNLEQYPYIIEMVTDCVSYEREGLLYMYQKGIVIGNKWIKKEIKKD